ncbi:glycosyltransferase family 4 protein [soil metagenome]
MPPPTIAIVAHVETPYRVALHRRFAREIPEIALHTLYTHGHPNQPWADLSTPDINPVPFGPAESVERRPSLPKLFGDYFKAGRIIRWLTAHNARAVFISGYYDVGRVRLFRWCHRRGIPVFLLADSNILSDEARGARAVVKRLFVGRIINWSTAILTFASAGARFYFRYGADASKIIFCPHEPDYAAIESTTPAHVAAVGTRFALDPARTRFVCCGRLEPVKRPDLAVTAFVAAAPRLPDWDLVMIGDGALRTRCASLVPAELQHRVKFLGFLADPRDIAAVYLQSHILIVPSDSEAWGLVVNEAETAGMAVIASDVVGAIPELIRPGRNGATFPRGDTASLTAAMLALAEPSALARARAASPRIIADWRTCGDPVTGMRLALARAGVLGPAPRHRSTHHPVGVDERP